VRQARMYTALWDSQANRPDEEFSAVELAAKRHLSRYGRCFTKMLAQSSPFAIEMLAVDPYDMVVDPLGGEDMENHRFVAQDGIFKSREDLLKGVEEGRYDKNAVRRLLKGPGTDKSAYLSEADISGRFTSLSLSGYGYESCGETLYRLVEHVTYKDGERVKLVWSPEARIIISERSLKETEGIDLLPWSSCAAYPDEKVFWTKAPDDDVRQAAEAMRVTLMEMMHNVQKRNWGTRVFDPRKFNPGDIIWSPDGLIPSKDGASEMPGGLQGGMFEIQTPDISMAINVTDFLDRFVGQKSGVTPAAQGQSEEERVGIYYGNLEQVAGRVGLQSRHYRRMMRRNAVRFLHLAKRYLKGNQPVQVIGAEGNEFVKLTAKQINTDVGIEISSGSVESQATEKKRGQRVESLKLLRSDPQIAEILNLREYAREVLTSSGFEDGEAKLMLTKDIDSEWQDQRLRAMEKVEELLEGRKPLPYQGAKVSFLKTVLDAAEKYTDSEGADFEHLMAFAKVHVPIVARNMAFDVEKKVLEVTREEQPPEEPQAPQEVQEVQDVPADLTGQPNVPQMEQEAPQEEIV